MYGYVPVLRTDSHICAIQSFNNKTDSHLLRYTLSLDSLDTNFTITCIITITQLKTAI